MALPAHIPPTRSPERPVWIAAAIGLGLTAGWMFVPAARVVLVACAVVAGIAVVRRLVEQDGEAGADAAPRSAPDPVAVLADQGIRDLEAYLARHLEFAAYLERRELRDGRRGERPAG